MISVREVEIIHRSLIDTFGGSHGIRDKQLLESALSRPFQTFDGKELYIHPIERGAALIESLLINHPFVDGNKRIGYVVLRLFLIKNGLDITASQDNKYEFVVDIASGLIKYNEIVKWLQIHTRKTDS